MRLTRPVLVGLALAFLASGEASAFDETKPSSIGLARVDITPTFPVRLGGYLVRTVESVGVDQKIWAKALAIGDDNDPEGPAILISIDSLGVSDATVEGLAQALKPLGVRRGRLAVSASHTHSAPCMTDVAPHIFGKKLVDAEQAAVDRYTAEVREKLVEVAKAALKDRKPSTLAWGQGTVKFAANRRTRGGPVDHSLPVLRVSWPNGKVRGIVVNYACHCTTANPGVNKVSGDWAGHAQAEIEALYPGSIALTVVGCGADANPLKPNGQNESSCQINGKAIADEVARVLKGPLVALSDRPKARFERFKLNFETLPTRDDLKALIAKGGPPGYNASVYLARLDRGEAIPETLGYSVQTWAFGDDLLMVFLPGEVVVDYVLRLKKELDPSRLWVTAYSNDSPCYIPSERILKEGGYEGGGAMVYYAQPTKLRTGIEDTIVGEVLKQAGTTFAPRNAGPGTPNAKTPLETLNSIHVPKGFKVELVASEPLVVDPVAIDWGTDGKLWVCEMRDYPTGIDGRWKAGGTISYLEDTDRDGRYDKSTLFADGLPFPTGVMAWRKGVLVCAAPEILYFEDTNGDGKADVRKVLFQGFATENYQARVNGLSYNLDNWVHGANGLIGGSIRGTASGKTIDIGGRDFRIQPDTGVMEPASGLTQQGRIHDDWGNQYGGNNSAWIQHYPFPDHYARRNPNVAAPGPTVYLPQGPDSSRLYPSSPIVERYNHPESANHVTSACSPMIYRDDLLTGLKGNAFICEPVHNLVHREVLTPESVTFRSQRAAGEEASEFLAGDDPWFRPVQVRTGPDGAIYVVDMYRYVIEHPRWISPERLATLNFRAGDRMGRIYRVVPETQPLRPTPILDTLKDDELARAIDHPNGTWRDNVHRLLVHRGTTTVAPILSKIAESSTYPEARVHALAALDGLKQLTPDPVLKALHDSHPGVCRQALRLAEGWIGSEPRIQDEVIRLASDRDIPVRFQAALCLGVWDDPRASQALSRIALGAGSDRWLIGAVLSSAVKRPGNLLADVLATPGDANSRDRQALIAPLLTTLVAQGTRPDLGRAFDGLLDGRPEPWRVEAIASLFEADDRPGPRSGTIRDLAGEPGRKEKLASLFGEARRWATAESSPVRSRLAGVRLLGREPEKAEPDVSLLKGLLASREPEPIQRAALRALVRRGSPREAVAILDAWPGFGPALRVETLEALLGRPGWTSTLLDALKAGSIRTAEIPASYRQRLIQGTDSALRARAESIFATGTGPRSRQAVVDAYLKGLKDADAGRGEKVFGKVCATCHKLGKTGHDVGPDLAALTDLTREGLTIAILDPNRDVNARYAQYSIALKDGRVASGLIASETANAVAIKGPEGRSESILRSDIDELKTQGQSLMPEGLEKDVTPQDLLDVVAYLNQQGPKPKVFAGNHPRLVTQAADGTIRLTAADAEIYGRSLAFEPEYGNLGLWHGADDHAAWKVKVDQAGPYTITMEWACEASSAGNPYEIRAGSKAARGVVGATAEGNWSSYRTIFVAETNLNTGLQRVDVRPLGAPRSALFDLKAIILTPRNDGVKSTRR